MYTLEDIYENRVIVQVDSVEQADDLDRLMQASPYGENINWDGVSAWERDWTFYYWSNHEPNCSDCITKIRDHEDKTIILYADFIAELNGAGESIAISDLENLI